MVLDPNTGSQPPSGSCTPVGPLRLEVASKDFTDDWRFNLGVGWKF